MANSPTVVNFSAQDLAAFEGSAVSDGTYADVLQTTKVDSVAAPASSIDTNAGELWANMVDDFIRAAWDQLRSLTWVTALEVDFASQPALDIAAGSDGTYAIAGQNWACQNVAKAAAFGVVPGVGFQITHDTTSSNSLGATLNCPQANLEIFPALGSKYEVGQSIRLWMEIDVSASMAAAPATAQGMFGWRFNSLSAPFSSGQNYIVTGYGGNGAGATAVTRATRGSVSDFRVYNGLPYSDGAVLERSVMLELSGDYSTVMSWIGPSYTSLGRWPNFTGEMLPMFAARTLDLDGLFQGNTLLGYFGVVNSGGSAGHTATLRRYRAEVKA